VVQSFGGRVTTGFGSARVIGPFSTLSAMYGASRDHEDYEGWDGQDNVVLVWFGVGWAWFGRLGTAFWDYGAHTLSQRCWAIFSRVFR
jgi:hypothetical protein